MAYLFEYKLEDGSHQYRAEVSDELEALFLFAEDIAGLEFYEGEVFSDEELCAIIEQECCIEFDYRVVE